MPLYEVVLEESYAGQQCINRWNYVGSGTPAAVQPSFALLSALGFLAVSTTFVADTVAGGIQLLQNPSVIFVQATARAVFVDEDFYGNGFLANTFGLYAGVGQPMTPINAYGFRSSRVKQSIGRGYKRFVGMSEGTVEDVGNISSAALTKMTTLAGLMSDTITYDDEGTTLTFTPCIAQKEKYTTDSGKFAYKYYATETEQAPHLAQGIEWETYTNTRSQTSRQFGRGS